MSIELGNGRKLLGQVASNKGYSDLIAAAHRPALVSFFANGHTQYVDGCIEALTDLAKDKRTAVDVASTATGLAKLMKGQKLVVLTNGAGGASLTEAFNPDQPRVPAGGAGGGEFTSGGAWPQPEGWSFLNAKKKAELIAAHGGVKPQPGTWQRPDTATKPATAAQPTTAAKPAPPEPSPAASKSTDSSQPTTASSFKAATESSVKMGTLKPEEANAIRDYSNSSGTINKALYTGSALSEWNERMVPRIDAAIAKGALRENVVVYRGLGMMSKAHSDVLASMKPGETFTAKGYSSTSTSKQEYFKGPVNLEIRVPKGTPAHYIGEHDEKEVLLPRNLSFRVVENRGIQSSGAFKGSTLVVVEVRHE